MTATAILVGFADFWPTFNVLDNLFLHFLDTLSDEYSYEVVEDQSREVDVLFYSLFGFDHRTWPAKRRIHYAGENSRPPLNEADLSFTFDRFECDIHVRLPLWVLYVDWYGKDLDPEHVGPEALFAPGRKFHKDQEASISMMNSNPQGFRRELFPLLLSELGDQAVSLGNFMTSEHLDPVPFGGKLAAIRMYKLHLAIENSVYPGYCTEKILQAFGANTVPVYYGDPTVAYDFNPDAFLNINGMTAREALEAIKDLLNDEARMARMLAERPIKDPGFTVRPYIDAIRGVLER